MRRATTVFVVLAVLAVGAVLLVGAGRETELAFTLGVTPGNAVANPGPGEQACQDGIDVPQGGGFDAVTVPLDTFGRTGPPLQVVVRRTGARDVLARGSLPGGYTGAGGATTIRVTPAVPEGTRIAVCLRNAGSVRVGIRGNADIASPTTTLLQQGKPVGADAALTFVRARRSTLSGFGVSADHAALFKAGWVGPWTFWVLAALVALGVPALLAFALARAGREDD